MRPLRVIVVMAVCVGSGCAGRNLFPHSAKQSQEEQLDELVRTINDDPNPLHGDYTPSVDKLIKVGDVAIPRVLDLMLSDDEITRLRAQRVLEGITLAQYGFVCGQGWRDPKGEERYQAFWKSLGGLSWNAPREDRERAVKLWREWLAKRKA
jgi:hypothetical protein